MEPTTTIIVAIISSGVLSTLITVIANAVRDARERKEKEKNQDNDLRAGVRLCLYFFLHDRCLKSISAGWIDPDDLKVLMETHATYKALGGDGYCDSLMKDVVELPKKKI